MRFVHICLLIAITSATKFLDETTVFGQEAEVQITYDQSQSLFTEDQLTQNTEFRVNNNEPFDYQSEQISQLQSVEQQQILLAYEKDLLPQGDCVILYAECQFKGTSKQVCKGVEEVMSFSLPVFSIYVPELQQFSTIDVNSNSQVTFLTSDKCLDQPIIMADSQLDFFIAKSMSNWIGQNTQITSLIQQDKVENQNTTDQQVDQQVQESSDVNVEQQVDQTQTEQQVDQQQIEQQVDQQQAEQQVDQQSTEQQVDQQSTEQQVDQQQTDNEQQSTQLNEETQQSTEQNSQSDNQQELSQENTTNEQTQENQTEQTDQSQEQQPEEGAQNEELQEKEMQQVVETVTEIVEQVEEKQEVELESEKEQLKQEEEAQQQQQIQQQTEQSVDDIPQNQESQQQYPQTETAEPLVGQSQYTK